MNKLARLMAAGVLGGKIVPWYLKGGLVAGDCLAAYQAIGAADYAASKVNRANPGTYDIADGAAYPTWDAASGWKFTRASSQYLDTGLAPSRTTVYSYIVRFSNHEVASGAYTLAGTNNGSVDYVYLRAQWSGGLLLRNGADNLIVAGEGMTSGVLAVTNKGYKNGISMGNLAAWNGGLPNAFSILIGGFNNAGTPAGFVTAYVQAFAIFKKVISAAQVLAITNAMAALP